MLRFSGLLIGKKITLLTSDPVSGKQKRKKEKKKENHIVSKYKKSIKTDRKECISYDGVTGERSHIQDPEIRQHPESRRSTFC